MQASFPKCIPQRQSIDVDSIGDHAPLLLGLRPEQQDACGAVAFELCFLGFPSSSPQVPIERPVLDGFGKMLWTEAIFTSEVGDSSSHFSGPNNMAQMQGSCPLSLYKGWRRPSRCPVFNTPFVPLRDKNRPFCDFLAQLHKTCINVLNREVFDKQTTSIFPSCAFDPSTLA